MQNRLPRRAVESLVEFCQKLGEETGRPAAKIFREYLEWMKKHADYFFSQPWPKEPDEPPGLTDKDAEFIEGGKSYKDRCERFMLVCLRKNISLKGFDSEGFAEDFRVYGGKDCWDCVVPEAMELRKKVGEMNEYRKMVEEEMKGNPSQFIRDWYAHMTNPETIRQHKMLLVQLRLCEELGGAEGKTCETKNEYRCPYAGKSRRLIEDGRLIRRLWRYVEWYREHWYRSSTHTPSPEEMRWYHYDEPDFIDVTSYEDILEAIDDGRLHRIIEEYERYFKEVYAASNSASDYS